METSTRHARTSDSGTVKARDMRGTAERVPERPAEESRKRRFPQVGPGGWFPRNKQPRDAHRLMTIAMGDAASSGGTKQLRKEGGTAGFDVSRPFSPVRWSHRDVGWRPHSFASQSRRERQMQNPAASIDHESASIITTTPELKPVPSVSQKLSGPASERTSVLGGPQVTALPAFSVSTRLRGRHVLVDTDLTPDEMNELLDTAARIKRLSKTGQAHGYLAGKTLGLIFQHPSTRTRVSLEAGMAQLGGQAIFLGVNDLQMKRGETIGDTAQILSRYVDALVARVADHNDLIQLATSATIPVMNGLSDKCHPLQAFADLLTLQENFGELKGLKLAYLGDGNNMAVSLMLSGAAMGISVAIAAPPSLQPDPAVVQHAQWLASSTGATIEVTDDPLAAAKDADAVYTDVHVSMGQEDAAGRAVALAPYKVTSDVMNTATKNAVFMHCLPMHRDEEVAVEVADGPRSIIFDQAENRLHMHKALLVHTMC